MPGMTPEELESTHGGKDTRPDNFNTVSRHDNFFRPSPDSHLGAIEHDRDWEYEDPRSLDAFLGPRGFRICM